MSTTAIIINSTDGFGKSAQKAMTCVNPEATNAELAALGQMITAASNNTYGNTIRVDKTDCDLEAGAAQKTTPTLTASKTTYSLTEFSGDTIKEAGICDLTYNGDGALFIDKAAIDAGLGFTIEKPQAKYYLTPRYQTAPTVPLTFTVGFNESETYKACSVEITVTA